MDILFWANALIIVVSQTLIVISKGKHALITLVFRRFNRDFNLTFAVLYCFIDINLTDDEILQVSKS